MLLYKVSKTTAPVKLVVEGGSYIKKEVSNKGEFKEHGLIYLKYGVERIL